MRNINNVPRETLWGFAAYNVNKFDFTHCYDPTANDRYLVKPESNKYRIIAYFIEIIVGFYFGHLKVELSKK